MVDVGERLENPFNIDNVVEPVYYKVSDAIMNFQESGVDISDKVGAETPLIVQWLFMTVPKVSSQFKWGYILEVII